MCENDITGQVPATSCYEAALLFALEHVAQVEPGWKFTVRDPHTGSLLEFVMLDDGDVVPVE
jgi:hypothetical protein